MKGTRMSIERTLDEKACAGNSPVRFDEGEVALAATPRRGALLYTKENVLKCVSMTLTVLGCIVSCADLHAADRVKFIGTGWDMSLRTPEQILAQADEFAATGLDGVSISVPTVKDASGKSRGTHHTMTAAFFTKEIADRYVPIFREITSKKGLRHSFVICNWCPIDGNRLDWRDDEAWKAFASNMRAIAYLAKKGGLEGILVDDEDYGNKGQFFRSAVDPPIPEAQRLARQRGREIGRAMFEEFPNARIMLYRCLGIENSYFRVQNRYNTMQAYKTIDTTGWLCPPFMDGIFDVISPTATLVDGDECGYGYKAAKRDFEVAIARRFSKLSLLLSPENRGKYRAQTSFGFGQYLDSYFRKQAGDPEDEKALAASRMSRFAENLAGAAEATEEYVWIYGEKCLWVNWKDFRCHGWQKMRRVTWESQLPGLAKTLERLKDPYAWTIKTADALKAGKAKNLIAGALVKPNTWQSEKLPAGTFSSIPGAGIGGSPLLRAENVRGGCFIPDVHGVAPGDELIAEAYVRGDGSMHLRWTLDNVWAWNFGGVIAAAEPPDAEGWRRMTVYAVVPKGINGVRLKLNVHDLPGLTTEYSGVAVWRIRSAEKENGKEQSK